MSFVTENVQLTPPKGSRNGQTLVPFSFQADGAGASDLTRFEYEFVEAAVAGHVVTLTFDWDLPDDVTVLARPTNATAPSFTIVDNVLTVTFTGAAAGDSYEILLGMSRDGEVELSTDRATGLAKLEDAVNFCFGATGENRSLGSVIGEFEVFGGGLAELTYSRGFKVTDEGSGAYRVHVGRFDDEKACTIVSTSFGLPTVTYDGEEGWFQIDLGSAPTNAGITFAFNTVL